MSHRELCLNFKNSRTVNARLYRQKAKDYFKENNQLSGSISHGLFGFQCGCRCGACCLAANNSSKKTYQSDKNRKSAIKNGNTLDDLGLQHGSSGYKNGCRCDVCIAENNNSQAAYLKKRKDYFAEVGEFLSPKVMHGTQASYLSGCRCDICATARKELTITNRKKHKAHFAETGEFLSPKVKHGTQMAYTYGCRCADCKAFISEGYKKRRESKNKEKTYDTF